MGTPEHVIEVRENHRFDEDNLAQYLEGQLEGLAVDLHGNLSVAVSRERAHEDTAVVVLVERLNLHPLPQDPSKMLRLGERSVDARRRDLQVVFPRDDVLDVEDIPDDSRDMRAIFHPDATLRGTWGHRVYIESQNRATALGRKV